MWALGHVCMLMCVLLYICKLLVNQCLAVLGQWHAQKLYKWFLKKIWNAIKSSARSKFYIICLIPQHGLPIPGTTYVLSLFLVRSRWCHSRSILCEFHRDTVSHLQPNLKLMKERSSQCPNGRTKSPGRKQDHSFCRTLTKQAIWGSQEEVMEKRKVCDLAGHRELWASTDLSR